MMNFDNCFRLGDEYPDWWHKRVITNEVMTFNDDDRWRGGPDKARIIQGQNVQWARKGDLIVLQPDGFIEVIPVAKVDLDDALDQMTAENQRLGLYDDLTK
jgi:hypothetical protein